ncbi:MAG TPA: hypothetical protein VKD26_02440 [Streptosporangiaceae bacterium]|nr:hypothetical protein [Streptosporangiaceae bacterium]
MSEHDGGGSVAETQALSPAERAELEALRAEIVKLRERPERAPRHRMSWRTPVATLLIVVGCLLAPISVLGVWTANQVSDTNRYIANVTPLISQPPIQHALTDKITNAIVAQINVPNLTSQATTLLTQKGLNRVATLLQGLSGPLNSAVAGYIHGQVAKIISGPRMANAWVQVNQAAHQEIVAALSGRTNGNGAITVSNGQVTVGLAPFIDIAKQDLAARGLTIVNKLPSINPTFALFPSKDLVKAQTAYRLINDLKIVLPILSLLLIAVGVYIARGHRRALIGAGLGFAASMLVLAAGLAIARSIYLNSVPSNVLPGDAAAAAFDVLVRFIKPALRTLLVVGLVVAAAAFLTGPSVTATATRRAFSSGLGWIRRGGETHGVRTGPVGAWTFAHRRGLRIGAVALAALLFVFQGRPTATDVIVLVILLLVVLGLIELIGRPPAAAKPA